MQNEWILDVLTDLRTFARRNGLGALAKQLDDTQLVATSELTSKSEGCAGHEKSPALAAGRNIGDLGRRY